MKAIQWLSPSAESDKINSFGLVIEPKLFTAYFYADTLAQKTLGFKQYDMLPSDEFWNDIESLIPLYAIGFDVPWTLVPLKQFEPDDCYEYLHFSTAVEPNAILKWDELIGPEIALVYGLPNRWNSLLPALPGIEIRHGIGALIEFGRMVDRSNAPQLALLHLAGNLANLIIFESGKLRFANSLSFDHLEEIRYFFFYSLDQLGLSTSLPVYLLGDADKNAAIAAMLRNYLPELINQFPALDNQLHESSGQHWIGQNASRCAL